MKKQLLLSVVFFLAIVSNYLDGAQVGRSRSAVPQACVKVRLSRQVTNSAEDFLKTFDSTVEDEASKIGLELWRDSVEGPTVVLPRTTEQVKIAALISATYEATQKLKEDGIEPTMLFTKNTAKFGARNHMIALVTQSNYITRLSQEIIEVGANQQQDFSVRHPLNENNIPLTVRGFKSIGSETVFIKDSDLERWEKFAADVVDPALTVGSDEQITLRIEDITVHNPDKTVAATIHVSG